MTFLPVQLVVPGCQNSPIQDRSLALQGQAAKTAWVFTHATQVLWWEFAVIPTDQCLGYVTDRATCCWNHHLCGVSWHRVAWCSLKFIKLARPQKLAVDIDSRKMTGAFGISFFLALRILEARLLLILHVFCWHWTACKALLTEWQASVSSACCCIPLAMLLGTRRRISTTATTARGPRCRILFRWTLVTTRCHCFLDLGCLRWQLCKDISELHTLTDLGPMDHLLQQKMLLHGSHCHWFSCKFE